MKFTGKWLPDANDFRSECLKIAKDLSGFKRNPVYCRFINNDNRPYETAFAFYQYIVQHYPWLLDHFEKFKANDEVGHPTRYYLGPHVISPGTLRFIKVLGDIEKFEWKSIVEIGSGYGGQCKVTRSLYDYLYTCIDIPESLAVAKAYLGNDPRVRFVSCEDYIHQRRHDLVISDYCLSEMNQAGVDFYLETVVRYCYNGYFTCNTIGVVNYLIEQLQQIFHQVDIQPEEPKTSKHENLIIYAMGNRYMQ